MRAGHFAFVFLPALALLLGLVACCHSDTETGSGSWGPCETCPGLPVNLACSKQAEAAALSDAMAKARVRCGANKLTAGGFDVTTPAACVRRGNEWFVTITVSQHFTCCN